jgi:hypothetical protein
MNENTPDAFDPDQALVDPKDFGLIESVTNRLILNEQQFKVHKILEGLSLQKDQFGQWYLASGRLAGSAARQAGIRFSLFG